MKKFLEFKIRDGFFYAWVGATAFFLGFRSVYSFFVSPETFIGEFNCLIWFAAFLLMFFTGKSYQRQLYVALDGWGLALKEWEKSVNLLKEIKNVVDDKNKKDGTNKVS